MLQFVSNFINALFQYSSDHGVNPYVFITLYLISVPIFYYPLIYLKRIAKTRNDKETIKKYAVRGIIISSTAYVIPLVYVLVFGRNLPLWLVLVVCLIVFANILVVVRKYNLKG